MNVYCHNEICKRYNKETFVSDRIDSEYVLESTCGKCREYTLHFEEDQWSNELGAINFRDWIASQSNDLGRWDDDALRAVELYALWWRKMHE